MSRERRSRNLRDPGEDAVNKSLAEIVRVARRAVERDHNNGFVSKKERDHVTDVYLFRARQRIVDGLDS